MHPSQHTCPRCPKKNGVGEWELDLAAPVNPQWWLKGYIHEKEHKNTSCPSLCFCACRQLTLWVQAGWLILLCSVKSGRGELWVFDFICELYQPGRETSALASGDGDRRRMEASGSILEQIIAVHGYTCLSSCPWALTERWKLCLVGLPGVCVQHLQLVSCWGMLGVSWDPELALCLTPKEAAAQDSFLKTVLARKRMCLFLAWFWNCRWRWNYVSLSSKQTAASLFDLNSASCLTALWKLWKMTSTHRNVGGGSGISWDWECSDHVMHNFCAALAVMCKAPFRRLFWRVADSTFTVSPLRRQGAFLGPALAPLILHPTPVKYSPL